MSASLVGSEMCIRDRLLLDLQDLVATQLEGEEDPVAAVEEDLAVHVRDAQVLRLEEGALARQE
eukprot:11994675-Alexandrium_andersonii.AAC.1